MEMALTAGQKHSVIALAIQGAPADAVAAKYPGDEEEVKQIHAEMTQEMRDKPLQAGQSWVVGNDW